MTILDVNGIAVSDVKPASPAKRAALERAHMNKERSDASGIDARFKLAHGFLGEFIHEEHKRQTDPRELVDVLTKNLAAPIAAFLSIVGNDAEVVAGIINDHLQMHIARHLQAARRGKIIEDAAGMLG